jgi:hypothetical protein
MDICGLCGSTEANPDTALCGKCGGDHWVQPEDLVNPDLRNYVADAAKNLGVSLETLHALVMQ